MYSLYTILCLIIVVIGTDDEKESPQGDAFRRYSFGEHSPQGRFKSRKRVGIEYVRAGSFAEDGSLERLSVDKDIQRDMSIDSENNTRTSRQWGRPSSVIEKQASRMYTIESFAELLSKSQRRRNYNISDSEITCQIALSWLEKTIDIIYQDTGKYLESLQANFGLDFEKDIVVGEFMERDVTIDTELYVLNIIDNSHLFMLSNGNQSISKQFKQLKYYDDFLNKNMEYIQQSNVKEFGIFKIMEEIMQQDGDYKRLKDTIFLIQDTMQDKISLMKLKLIVSWVHGNALKILHYKNDGNGQHMKCSENWMYDLWYNPTWLLIISSLNNDKFNHDEKKMLSDFEYYSTRWMNNILKLNIQSRHFQAFTQAQFNLEQVQQFINDCGRHLKSLYESGSAKDFQENAHLWVTPRLGWIQAQQAANFLLQLRYDIVVNYDPCNLGHISTESLNLQVFEMVLNIFKKQFMIGNWMVIQFMIGDLGYFIHLNETL